MDFSKLRTVLGEENVSQGVRLADYTTFRIGGPADILVRPQNVEQLQEVINGCQKLQLPWILLGKGSNVLANDEGFHGVVICPEGDFLTVHTEGYQIRAGCGASLAKVAREALDHELTGMEFASGIPGSLGGAVYMNAGAYGREMSQVLVSICYLDQTGIHTIGPDEARFDYRNSRFMQEGSLVLEAVLQLKPGERRQIQDQMQELARRRKREATVGISECRQYVQASGGVFCRKADSGRGTFRVCGRRSPKYRRSIAVL